MNPLPAPLCSLNGHHTEEKHGQPQLLSLGLKFAGTGTVRDGKWTCFQDNASFVLTGWDFLTGSWPDKWCCVCVSS